MKRVRVLLGYVVLIVLFYFFSNLLIDVFLKARYEPIEQRSNLTQVNITEAKATKINGKILGSIFNDEKNKIGKNYLRIDLYSKRDILLGSEYIDVSNMRDNETRNFEANFKIQNVEYYKMEFVDKK